MATITTATNVYAGPDANNYAFVEVIALNTIVYPQWREGSYVYIEYTTKKRGYVLSSAVSDPGSYYPPLTLEERYGRINSTTYLGPNATYPTSGSISANEEVNYVSPKKDQLSDFAFIEYQITGDFKKKRVWIPAGNLVFAHPAGALRMNTTITPGSWNQNYPLSDLPAGDHWFGEYNGGESCIGFGRMVLDATHGTGSAIPANDFTTTTALQTLFNSIYVGDRVTFRLKSDGSQHSMIIAGKSSAGITAYDCNRSTTDPCVIKYEPLTWQDLVDRYNRILGANHRSPF